MKLKAFKGIILCLLMIFSGMFFVSCEDKPVDDTKTIRISYAKAGFGDEWIKQAVSLFNKTFEKEGWVAVIDRNDPNASNTCENEIKYPDDNKFDLYFDMSPTNATTAIEASYQVLKSRDQALLACLDDVYDSYPIDTTGKEETTKIIDNVSSATLAFVSYTSNPSSKFYGKKYQFQWTSACAGFCMNKAVLEQFGLDVPVTTQEFKEACDAILTANQNSLQTGNKVYPITWPGYNASGYLAYAFETWIAQWKGVQGFKDFYALIPETGTTVANGYDVYNDEGILHALEAGYTFIDPSYATNGTVTTIDHLTSEMILADGEACFAITGDWAYNELIGCGYDESELTDIVMMAVPIMSELAQKINLPGSTEAEQEANLRTIIKMIDAGNSNAEIKTAVAGVTDEQIERLKEARGVYFDLGTTHTCFIPSYSNCIEGAKLFLRFIASKDFAQKIYATYAHGVTANRNANVTGTPFTESISKITKQSYSNPVGSFDKISEIRSSGAISFVLEPVTSWPDLFKGMANRVTGYEPNTIYTKVRDGMANNWESIIITSGVYEE